MTDQSMTHLQVRTNLDIAPLDDVIRDRDNTSEGTVILVGLLPNATARGLAAVVMVIDFPDGRQAIANITWRAFHAAHVACAASPVITPAESEDF